MRSVLALSAVLVLFADPALAGDGEGARGDLKVGLIRKVGA
jgi:hypothetical protein